MRKQGHLFRPARGQPIAPHSQGGSVLESTVLPDCPEHDVGILDNEPGEALNVFVDDTVVVVRVDGSCRDSVQDTTPLAGRVGRHSCGHILVIYVVCLGFLTMTKIGGSVYLQYGW